VFIKASENASLVVLGAERTRGRFAPRRAELVQPVLLQALCRVALAPRT
jgi:hypothetical protein